MCELSNLFILFFFFRLDRVELELDIKVNVFKDRVEQFKCDEGSPAESLYEQTNQEPS
jgi:hypothetical protein